MLAQGKEAVDGGPVRITRLTHSTRCRNFHPADASFDRSCPPTCEQVHCCRLFGRLGRRKSEDDAAAVRPAVNRRAVEISCGIPNDASIGKSTVVAA